MIAISGIVIVVLLAGLFFFLRGMGKMGQQPSPSERARHTSSEGRTHHPRANGLN